MILGVLLSLGAVSTARSRAPSGAFSWIEDPTLVRYGQIDASLGVAFFKKALFPASDFTGDLVELGWNELSIGVGSGVEFKIKGTFRKRLKVEEIKPAELSSKLRRPLLIGQTRETTGDFTTYTKIALPKPSPKFDLAILTGFTLPNTNIQSGVGLDQGAFHARFLAAGQFSQLRLVANVGMSIMPDPLVANGQDDFITTGLGASLSLGEKLTISSEFYGIFAREDGDGEVLFDSLNTTITATWDFGPVSLSAGEGEFLGGIAPERSFYLRLTRTIDLRRK